jgi:peptidoglycan/LPS O-acetylase OafA/YrhL
MNADKNDRWPALDGLRGVASLAVMAYHFVPYVPQRTATAFARALDDVAHVGWAGVDLFFVLSGFLITDILLGAKGGPAFLRNFYARRVLRIFPLYYGVLVAVFALGPFVLPASVHAAMGDTASHQGWLWAYTYDGRVLLTGQFWGDGGVNLSHVWSLSIEEHFYLVWPLVVAWADRRTLLRIALVLALLVPVARTVLVLAGVSHALIYSFTPCRMDSLLVGALVAMTFRDEALAPLLRRFAPAAVIVGGLGFGALIRVGDGSSGLTGPMAAVGYTVVALVGAGLVVMAVDARRTAVTGVLRTRVLRWFGRYSYGAYVFHYILQPVIVTWAPPARLGQLLRSEGLGILAHLLIAIFATMCAAVASYHLLELPFLRLKSFFDFRDRRETTSAFGRPAYPAA